MLVDRVCVACLRFFARAQAEWHAAADQKRATDSWKSWLHEGPAAGLKRQHHMSRIAAGWVPTVISVSPPTAADIVDDGISDVHGDCGPEELADDIERMDLEVPLDGQQAIDAEAAKWAAEWLVGHSPPLPFLPNVLGSPLLVPCVDAVRRACASFPAGTGLGWDHLRPRALLRCSREALIALLRILILAELLGQWPSSFGVFIIALVPKTDRRGAG
jgi:hypothetical protein